MVGNARSLRAACGRRTDPGEVASLLVGVRVLPDPVSGDVADLIREIGVLFEQIEYCAHRSVDDVVLVPCTALSALLLVSSARFT